MPREVELVDLVKKLDELAKIGGFVKRWFLDCFCQEFVMVLVVGVLEFSHKNCKLGIRVIFK